VLPLVLAVAIAGGPEGDVARGEDRPAPKALGAGDAALQSRIHDAIDAAVGYLRRTQNEDGSFGSGPWRMREVFGVGTAALSGLALRHGGVSSRDPQIVLTCNFVREGIEAGLPADPTAAIRCDVYTAALGSMLLVECGTPVDDPLVARLVALLADAWLEEGYWDYSLSPPRVRERDGGRVVERPRRPSDRARKWGNVSTSFYAVLGLHTLRRKGAVFDTTGVARLFDRLATDARTTGGFSYQSPDFTVEPSKPSLAATVSAAGIRAMCGEMTGRWTRPAGAAADPVIRAAVAYVEPAMGRSDWIWGPGRDANHSDACYSLHVVERLGMLLDTPRLGDVPWYELAARSLVQRQARDGHWEAETGKHPVGSVVCSTSWGLLVLARAGGPIGEAVTGGDAPPAAATGGDPLADAPTSAVASLVGLAWIDAYHRAMERLEGLGAPTREAFARRLACFGPGVVRMLVRDLEGPSELRRVAAHDALGAAIGEDFGRGTDDVSWRRIAVAWRAWLEVAGPNLTLADGRLVIAPPATPSAEGR
jgi:hypothetical protein